MIKSTTVETVEEFDKDGSLLRRTVTETESTDDNPTCYTHTSFPYSPYNFGCFPASYVKTE